MRLLEAVADPHERFTLREELEADEGADGAYAAAWRELRASDRAEWAKAVDREDRLTTALVARLARMRAPRALAAEHARLVAAFREYEAAVRALAARRDDDVAGAAWERVTDAERELAVVHATFADRLRWDTAKR